MGYESDENDETKAVSSIDTSSTAAGLIQDYLYSNQEKLVANLTYCALGAGDAIAELDMAKRMGISPDCIVLVDKKLGKILDNLHPDMEIIDNTDIFEYLNTTSKEYDLITAFGLEYVLNTKDKISAFVKGVNRVVKPGSFVVITGIGVVNANGLWLENGFESICEEEGFLIFRKYLKINRLSRECGLLVSFMCGSRSISNRFPPARE